MFNTLSNFTYARAQPLTQRTNTYQTPRSRSKLDLINCSGSGSLGKTVGILKRQNIRPKSPTLNQKDLYRAVSSNSEYQLNFSKSSNNSFFQQPHRQHQHHQQPQQIRNYKIITSTSSRTSKLDQIQILNQRIKRLTERVVSNEEQIFYLKSTKQSRMLPGLNMSDLKAIIQENQSQSKRDQNFIFLSQQIKVEIERLRQELQKTVKKRDFQKEVKDFDFKIRDLKNDFNIQISEIVYEMLEKLKKQINFSNNNLKASKSSEQINEKVFKLTDFAKKMEAEMQRQIKKIENIQLIISNHQILDKRIVQKLQKRNSTLAPTSNSALNSLYRSDFIFTSVPIKFTVQERLKFQKRQFKTAQTTYLIDKEGYLLDQQQHYLLNSLGEQIKLTEKQIKMLKSINVMV